MQFVLMEFNFAVAWLLSCLPCFPGSCSFFEGSHNIESLLNYKTKKVCVCARACVCKRVCMIHPGTFVLVGKNVKRNKLELGLWNPPNRTFPQFVKSTLNPLGMPHSENTCCVNMWSSTTWSPSHTWNMLMLIILFNLLARKQEAGKQ